jgi:hypothetical protein
MIIVHNYGSNLSKKTEFETNASGKLYERNYKKVICIVEYKQCF